MFLEMRIDELPTGRPSPIDQHSFSVADDEGGITLANIQEMNLDISLGDCKYTSEEE